MVKREICTISLIGLLVTIFYKKWEKTAKYYVLANGKTIKTNGVTNQAKTSSQRMDAFMKKNNLE